MDDSNSSKALPNSQIHAKHADSNYETSDGLNNTILDEASKILENEIKKDFIIREKDKIIQDSTGTIENLRQSIFHIQAKYENLKQNYQKEVSNAAEAWKRVDNTRNMLEAAEECSTILASSIQQLENDKFKLIELYEELRKKQEEEEEKSQKIEITIQDQQNFIENTFSQMVAEKAEMERKFSYDLSQTEDKLKHEVNKNVLLEKEIGKCNEEIKELRSDLVTEQTLRIKYQINQSYLKKKIINQKAENKKTLQNEKVLHSTKLRFLITKLKILKEKVRDTEKNGVSNSNNLRTETNDFEKKTSYPNENFHKVSVSHGKDMKEPGTEVVDNLTETANLKDLIRKREDEIIEKNRKIDSLMQENLTVLAALDEIKILLLEKENECKKLQEEHSKLKKKTEEILLESKKKPQKTNDVVAEIKNYKTEELTDKIKMYEEKLLKYELIERELRNEIVLLNDAISKERWKIDKESIKSRTRILHLEKEISEVQAQKEAMEKELKEIHTRYVQVKNELTIKSADIDKITQEFEVKMKMMSDEAELFNESKINLEKERQLNKKLLECLKTFERDSEMLKTSEETNNTLKKSLKTCEANEEAYKLVIKKLEEELANRKNLENQTIKKLQFEISQLKRLTQKNENEENAEELFETSRSRKNRRGKF